MKQSFFIILFFLFTSAMTLKLSAEDFTSCRKISNDAQRLSCYDNIVDRQNDKPSMSTSKDQNTATNEPAKHVENFGLKTKLEESEINSNLAGTFTGWNRDTKFELSNGQVWKVANKTERTYVSTSLLDQPKVTIKKGILGSHVMNVENVSKKVKVKRIK